MLIYHSKVRSSALSNPNTLPVRHQIIEATWRLGRSVNIPKPAFGCPVLDERNVAKDLFFNGEPVQLSLFQRVPTVPRDMPRREREATAATIQQRANSCADGSCLFIEDTEACFRRPENINDNAGTLFQPDLYGQQG